MDPLKTGNIILEARKRLKLTQKQLAKKLYVSDKAVSKWERGICFPDISVLIPLTEVLNINLYDLLKGEKMKNKEVEETLKNTIDFSNNEVRKKKKKYTIISLLIIFIAITISVVSVILVKNNSNQLLEIVKKDAVYNISYYKEYKTSINSTDDAKLERILMELPLNWSERTYNVNNDAITIIYDASYKKIVKTYKDECYVKLAMINASTVIFTTISDVNKVKIKFNDTSYTVTKKDLLKTYLISDFDELLDERKWNKTVSKKLKNNSTVENIFKENFNQRKN